MQIVNLKIEDLKPYEKNPRKNEGAVKYVANSIKEFGFKVPIVIDKDHVIVAGHTRYKAAQELGISEVPCIVAEDLTDAQIKAFRLADNKVAEKAEWDFNMLGEELGDLWDFDMSDFGFDDEADVEDFGTDFSLPDGGKPEIVTMTLTLHEMQRQEIEKAIEMVKGDVYETFGNENKNGNAVYEVVRQWVEQKTL